MVTSTNMLKRSPSVGFIDKLSNEAKFDIKQYQDMCRLMVQSTSDLNDKITENKEYLNENTKILFGPSKSGKSTFLLRLKSSMTPDEFMSVIKQSKSLEEQICDFEGIKIKAGFAACTTVPNFLQTQENLILDLAGFADTNYERDTVISLLNNTLFPKIEQCKIIIVMKLSCLRELMTSMLSYTKELIKVVGETNFLDALRSSVVIFTHFDEEEKLYEGKSMAEIKTDIRLKLLIFAAQVAKDRIEVNQFVSTISDRFMVVDYRTATQKECWDMVNQRLKNEPTLSASVMNFSSTLITNDLSKKAVTIMQYFGSELNLLMSNIQREHDLKQKSLMQHVHSIDQFEKHIAKLTSDLAAKKEKVNRLNDETRIHKEQLQSMKINRNNLMKKINDDKKALKSFDEETKSMLNVQPIIIRSILSDKKHKYYGKVDHPSGKQGDHKIVIVRTDNGDLERIKDLSTMDLNEMKLDFLYKDGAYGTNSNGMSVEMRQDSEAIQLKVVASNPFAIVYLCQIQVNKTSLRESIAKYFLDQESKNAAALSTINLNISDTERSIDSATNAIKGLKSDIDTIEQELPTDHHNLSLECKYLDNSVKSHCDWLDQQRNNVNSFCASEIFGNTKRLFELLNDARIVTNNTPSFTATKNQKLKINEKLTNFSNDVVKLMRYIKISSTPGS